MTRKFHIMLLIIAVVGFNCSSDNNESMAQNKAESSSQIDTTTLKNFMLTFNEGLEKAAKENKNMIVDFYTDWCHWCKVMDEKTFNNKDIAKKLSERFITVRINAESQTETATFKGQTFTNIELTRAFRVTGFPSLAFISPEHEVITVIPGYIPADKFIYILDYVDQKCWEKKMSLDEFIKRKGECDKSKDTETESNKM
ncbi:MAG: thioredoxin fold domain-containing protein [bacterium]|nr:MAG: thioredoxin fold domain-containing protein [bacterium]